MKKKNFKLISKLSVSKMKEKKIKDFELECKKSIQTWFNVSESLHSGFAVVGKLRKIFLSIKSGYVNFKES